MRPNGQKVATSTPSQSGKDTDVCGTMRATVTMTTVSLHVNINIQHHHVVTARYNERVGEKMHSAK